MSDYDKNSNSKLLVIAIVIAAIAGVGYFLLSGKTANHKGDATTETVSEEMTAETPTAEQPSEENLAGTEQKTDILPATDATPDSSVLVETKTLTLPAAKTPEIPVSEISSDPVVEKMMGLRKIGSDSAPIKVVEYASLTCGHCGSFHHTDFPVLKKDYIDTGKVQFIFKEFPLNKPAVDASKLLRCMPEDKFMPFQSTLFETQDKWAYNPEYLSILKQNAKLAGLADKDVEDCLNNKDLENRIIGDMKAGTDKYKISSTPTFIVNDGVKTLVGHQPIEVFRETFDSILGGTAPATAPAAAPAPAVEEKKE